MCVCIQIYTQYVTGVHNMSGSEAGGNMANNLEQTAVSAACGRTAAAGRAKRAAHDLRCAIS